MSPFSVTLSLWGYCTQRLIPPKTRLVTNCLTLSRHCSSLGAISRTSFQRGQQ